nr:hypothetical protein [Tanacetum cinerariifolium]
MEIRTQQSEEPERTLKDKFQDLHLNLSVLKVLAHAPIYNAILDKYVKSLELGKNKSAFIQGEMHTKIEDLGHLTLPCRLGDSKPFDTLADLGSCVNIIPLYLFKKLKIGLLEETNHIFGLADETKSYPIGIVRDLEVHIGKLKLLNDFYIIDIKKDLETPLLVGKALLVTANTVIDCKKSKIAVGEGIISILLEVTNRIACIIFFQENKCEVFTKAGDGVRIIPDGVSMDHGTANVPRLLAQYLFRHAEGRKSGASLSGGHFIWRLVTHFGLVSDEGLRGLQVVTRELPLIDLHELGGLNICSRFGDTWAWVAPGLKRQQAIAAGAHEADEASLAIDECAHSQMPYQRHVRPTTGDASTSTVPHTDDQPDP